MGSHPTRGAWIETSLVISGAFAACCRTPPGGRGLKPDFDRPEFNEIRSHPTRGAWIETLGVGYQFVGIASRTPPGVRGLKPREA